MTRTPRHVARQLSLVHGLIHSYMLLLPALVPLLAAHFGVSEGRVNTVGNLHYLAFGLGAVPAGLLADRLGSRRVLLMCLAGCVVSGVLIATATHFHVMAVGLVGLGAATSLYHPSGLALLSRTTESQALGRALGVHGIGGNLGEAMAPATASLLAALVDWRLPFVFVAVSAAVLAVLTYRLPRDESDGDAAGAHAHADATPTEARTRWDFRALWSLPLVVLLVAALLGGFVQRGAFYFMPRHLSHYVDAAQVGWLGDAAAWLAAHKGGYALGALVTTLALLTGVFSQWWGGQLADRYPRPWLYVIMACLLAPLVLGMGLTRGLPLVAVSLAFGFAFYLSQPLVSSMAAALVDRRRHGVLFGSLFTMSFGLGSFAVELGSRVAARHETRGAYLAFAALAALLLPLGLGLVATLRRRRRAAAR